MVKVQTNQPAVPDETVLPALLECAGKSSVVEVSGLERLALLRVRDCPQLPGSLGSIVMVPAPKLLRIDWNMAAD